MADVTQTIATLFSAQDSATPTIAAVNKALDGVDQQAQSASTNVGELTAGTDKLGAAMGAVGRIALAAFAAFSLAEVKQQFVDANIEAEKFARAMTVLTGSSTQAGAEFAYVRDVAQRLGLDVRATADAWIALSAAAKGTTLEGEASRKIFESISNAMSLLGKSSADTQGALLAVQQIISKGTVQSEELRGQLGERLPGAFQIAARAVGVTTAELGAMLQAGEVIAADFLPKFADEINKTFGDPARVESYTAAVNRLKNAWEQALQDIGRASGGLGTSLFDTLTGQVEDFSNRTQAAIIRYQAFRDLLRGGSLETYAFEIERAAKLTGQFTSVQLAGNESTAESSRLLRQNAEAISEVDVEMAKLVRQSNAQKTAADDLAAAFATLGVKPEKVKEIKDIVQAFDTLAASDKVSGGQLLAGLESVLKSIEDKKYLPKLKDDLQEAYAQGRITSDELVKGFTLIQKEQDGLDKKAGILNKTLEQQAKEAERAQEKAQQWALEMEKLASNERIKSIEARVNLNVEEVKAQTERIKAAFESIDKTIESTGNALNSAFSALTDMSKAPWQDSQVRNKLFEQIDRENANRREALRLQSDLTEAQIALLRAQTDQLVKGDALIKIDGSGLAPHLEAFMWEVLKAIQTRVNRDGLKLLLGT